MTTNNDETKTAPRKNLHAFLAANLRPVAQCIANDQNISIDEAKIIARPYLMDEWNEGARSLVSVGKTIRLVSFGTVIGWVAPTLMDMASKGHTLVALTGAGVEAGLLFAATILLNKPIREHKKSIYSFLDPINPHDKEDAAAYDAAQRNILGKFPSIKTSTALMYQPS